MQNGPPRYELPEPWEDALAEAAGRERVVVVGATDIGKSTFIRLLLERARGGTRLIDLDPGQKMLGPPGTATLGQLDPSHVERFIFLGSTSSINISGIAKAAASLRKAAKVWVANTSGFVVGPGARLQAATIRNLSPDLIIEIAAGPEAPALAAAASGEAPLIRLTRSPAARRKSPAERSRIRQDALDAALSNAAPILVPMNELRFEPAHPAPFPDPARPVCSLADRSGRDIAYGILRDVDGHAVEVLTQPPAARACSLRLGMMWAEPREGAWHLQRKLRPSWVAELS
jgi:polynucleotide 5'-hydroxyl-kinase GRC3/NOL9